MNQKRTVWLLVAICVLTVIPFLGIYEYNTKGEPRESIVSYNMIESGNWVLPRNSVGEMAYKPPFFHWSVAAVSEVCGEVNEFTSRLPSAIAYIALTIAIFVFYRRRRDVQTALVTALVTFTSWELHRQGFNCRVDMVLTAFTVGALLLLYRWYERGMHGVPLWAILLMSLGTLTKGPVGSLIPFLVIGVFLLCRGVNFFKAFFSLVAWGLLSFVIPALWYYAAWQQGQQEFLDLMLEENVGRMTNTMSYESCVEPWPYNFLTLIIGYLPWVVLCVMLLFALKWKRIFGSVRNVSVKSLFSVSSYDPLDLFSFLSIVVIFVFYCIPQSKRSVYLMPIYPFIGYFLARLLFWMEKKHRKVLNAYGGLLSVVGIIMAFAFVVLKFFPVEESWFHGRHGYDNYSMVLALQQAGSWWQWILWALGVVLFAAWWRSRRGIMMLIVLVLAVYLHVDAIYKPAVLNAKSVKEVAAAVDELIPESKGKLYEFIELGVLAKGDPVHYFEMNFYMHDRVGNFYSEKPQTGYLMIGTEDAERWLPKFEKEGYRFSQVYSSGKKRVFKQPLLVLHFEK